MSEKTSEVDVKPVALLEEEDDSLTLLVAVHGHAIVADSSVHVVAFSRTKKFERDTKCTEIKLESESAIYTVTVLEKRRPTVTKPPAMPAPKEPK